MTPADGDIVIPQKVGQMILTKAKLKPNVTRAEMTQFRVLNGIPWHKIDFNDEMILCVEDEDRISYFKGCYLGQEVIARVHYKGHAPKQLVTKMLRDCDADQRKQLTSRVTDPRSGDFIGFVFDKTEEPL
jgi:tRNA-modifying protein YgfZ